MNAETPTDRSDARFVDLLHRLQSRLPGELRPDDRVELALETACLTAWLSLSDEVVLCSEREALRRMLQERMALTAPGAERMANLTLQLDPDDLPSQSDLLQRVAARPRQERMKSIEALLVVASADGVLHPKELALLQRLAAAVGLSDTSFQELLAQHEATGAAAGLVVELGERPLTVGRKPDNAIQLPSLSVSGHHARFVPTGNGWAVEDLESRMGTRVNGTLVRRRLLRPNDLVQIENFRFRLEPVLRHLVLWNENDRLAVSVENLTVQVPHRETGEPKTILDSVSFSCFSGELVAITGPSGSGKTTLIHALLGTLPKTNGTVRINGQTCPNLLERYARRLGLVPQDDIVHGELTVEESLLYSGALRSVPGVSRREVHKEVDRVVGQLALSMVRKTRIGDPVQRGVSGGERKRVNLGQELLNPSTEILILDEPTTGLDPHTGLDTFRLLRALADQGKLVIVVTHRVDRKTLGLMDRLFLLGSNGRLAFFGPPQQAFDLFDEQSIPELFDALRHSERLEQLCERFNRSYSRRTHLVDVGTSSDVQPEVADAPESASTGSDARVASSESPRRRLVQRARQWLREYTLQTLRYGRIKSRDRTAMAINFGQVPLVALGCWIVLQKALTAEVAPLGILPVVPGALPFVLVIAAFWLGCVSAVRELVSEKAIYRRERMAGIGPSAYLLSKITVLAAIVALQSALLLGTCELFFGLRERSLVLWQGFLILFLVGLVGVGLGLCASASFRTPEAAVAVLPLLVIPQLLFGGLLVPFDMMPEPVAAASFLMASRWGVDGMVQSGDPGIGPGGQPAPRQCTRYTIPGVSAPCLLVFLDDIGLASRPTIGGRTRPRFSFVEILAALLALATLSAGIAYVALRRGR